MVPPDITATRSASSRISSRSSDTNRTAAPRLRCSMIWARISATDAKSRPKQGLATISTSTSLDSSRASTAPLHVAAGQVGDGGFGRLGFYAVALDQFARLDPHGARRQPPAEFRRRRLVEGAESHVFGDRHLGHGRVLERLFGQAENLHAVKCVAVGLERLVFDDDAAVLERPLSGQDLDQFGLAVARDARQYRRFRRRRP